MFIKTISQEKLKELLNYDMSTGQFYWLETRGRFKKDTIAGYIDNTGYIKIEIDGKKYRAHRLAWVYVHGSIPDGMIVDHIDGIKTDNRIFQLRLANFSQNNSNCGLRKNNKTGVKGVHFCRGKYRARIKLNGKYNHLGYFDTLEQAAQAYKDASPIYHGQFGRTSW